MQLGTRFPVGGPIPSELDGAFAEAIRSVEAELVGVDTTNWRWTLTWLERRPHAELDDGTLVHADHAGAVHITPSEG